MSDPLTWLAGATLLGLLLFGGRLRAERRHRLRLGDLPSAVDHPPVSIIIPVRNEERHLETALTSVLGLDYPDPEVIVVDDRSEDATPAILSRLSALHPSLVILRVDELPAGWLGKNHALCLGAARARGELLLFTDADVFMAPTALDRAVGHLQRTGLDHLAVGPRVTMPGWLLQSFLGAFMIFFTLYARPWKVRDPRSRAHIGIGAFNLVRTEAYRAVGGHRTIALRPDDDMQLGRLLKTNGYRQDLLVGSGMLEVEWYASLRELVAGLEKNTFAGVDYRLSLTALGSLACMAGFIWPYAALVVTEGAARLLNLGNVALLTLIYLELAAAYDLRRRYAVALPLATALFVYILWRSATKICLRGGMEWRGTRYPLRELRGRKR